MNVFKTLRNLFHKKPTLAPHTKPPEPQYLFVTPDKIINRTPIEKMNFGADEKPEERDAVVARVRSILKTCECVVADDIAALGCTGLAAHWGTPTGLLEAGKFLRLGIAGGGVGLPCFVPPTRFCLVHNTIGGLERGQVPEYPEQIDKVSRELELAERAHLAIVNQAQQVDDDSLRRTTRLASNILSGRDASAIEEAMESIEEEKN